MAAMPPPARSRPPPRAANGLVSRRAWPASSTWWRAKKPEKGQLFPIIDLRQYLGGGATPITRLTRILVVNHRDIPAGLVIDEVLGFRRFTEAEFSAEVPSTIVQCGRFLAGSFRHEHDQLPVLSLRKLLEEPAFTAASL